MKYSIIIPAYNEASRIESTLRDFASNFPEAELIVVVNGSTDNCANTVRAHAYFHPNARLIEVEERVGKGGAVKIGMLSANGQLVGFVDADGSTAAREMHRLCTLAEKHGAVIGSRWKSGARVTEAQSLKRRIASRVFNVCTRIMFGLAYKDTQCGAKVFRADILKRVLRDVDTANLAFDVDLLFALKRAGITVFEEPTEWADRSGSTISLAIASTLMFTAIVRLRLRHSFLKMVVPVFDRLFQTHPVRLHHGVRVLILNWRDVEHPHAGGAETYLHEIARRWVAKGHTVDWLSARFAGSEQQKTIDGILMHRVGNRVTLYFLAPLYYLRNLRDRYDVIIDSENGIPFFSPFFSLKKKVLVLYHVHRAVFLSQLRAPFSWLFVFLETKVMPFIYQRVPMVTISQDTADEMLRVGIGRNRAPVVYCGVDARLHRTAKSAAPKVVYLGRLNKYKRIDILIRSMTNICRVVPGAQLEIAGGGPEAEALQQLTRDLGLADNVTFLGYVPDEAKSEVLGSAWLFVMASEMEGWGISIIEANACGTPAVAFASPGVREAVSNAVTGMLVHSQQEFESSVIDLLHDHQQRSRLAGAAFQNSLQYNWDRASDEMLEVVIGALMDARVHLFRHGNTWSILARNNQKLIRPLNELESSPARDVIGAAEVSLGKFEGVSHGRV